MSTLGPQFHGPVRPWRLADQRPAGYTIQFGQEDAEIGGSHYATLQSGGEGVMEGFGSSPRAAREDLEETLTTEDERNFRASGKTFWG